MARFFWIILTRFSPSAFAHVKWFTRESFAKPPITFADLNTPTFRNLFVLSMCFIRRTGIFTLLGGDGKTVLPQLGIRRFTTTARFNHGLAARIFLNGLCLCEFCHSVCAAGLTVSHAFTTGLRKAPSNPIAS